MVCSHGNVLSSDTVHSCANNDLHVPLFVAMEMVPLISVVSSVLMEGWISVMFG